MAFVVADRVKETTTTTGTGTITLGGAEPNFITFTSALSDGDTTYYAIVDDANLAFEVGLGTFTASGTTLARTTVLASSNSGSAVNLQAGTKDVFINYPAGKSVFLNASNQLVINGTAVTATPAELNYVDGVTSAIQTQIDSKNALPIIKSGNYTASVGEFVVVSAGSITITLPASPSAGNTVTIKDGTGAAATTTFTVGRNGSNIASSASDLTFDKNFAEITMTYINGTIGWSV
tara:strand:+ start:417 stop:1121 length:705 start_codon:yes stop_codon:yes gene_type:complete